MRQIILNASGAMCVNVPAPIIKKGCVLIRVSHSFVSVGTEVGPIKASRLPQGQQETKIEAISRLTNLAGQYAYRALRHPDKAARRVRMIVQGQLHRHAATS